MSRSHASSVVLLLGLLGTPARAQIPSPMTAAGLDERVGAQVPLAVPFTAVGIGEVTLQDFVDGRRPVLLVLAYARCTMLCSLVLRSVTQTAQRLARAPGVDYQLVLIGLDDRETAAEAARKHDALLVELSRGATARTWPYLLGSRSSIDAVADAVGFRYAWDPRTEQYAHPAVLFVLTPDGRVSRYLHGLDVHPEEVDAALDAAAAGRLVTSAMADILRCFRFDPAIRRAGDRVQTFLRIGAAAMFFALLAFVALLVVWARRRGDVP